VPFPAEYGGFRLIRAYGCVYAVRPPADPEEMLRRGELLRYEGALSATNLPELKALIDASDPAAAGPEKVGECDGHVLFRHRGSFHGIPRTAGWVDLDSPEERSRVGVISAATRAEVEERLRRLAGSAPVEFAGWMPIYKVSGNCGQHPQFAHCGTPPPGYRFTSSAPPPAPGLNGEANRLERLCIAAGKLAVLLGRVVSPLFALLRGRGSLRSRLGVLGAVLRLFFLLLRRGARVWPTLRFLQSRHFQSQILLAPNRGVVFLTSMPYTFGQNPWVIEIEDPTTLFYPLIQNGHTSDLDLRESPYFPIVKTLLELDSCKAILTHVRSTARLVCTLFGSETIRRKVLYAPLGVELPASWQRHLPQSSDEPIELLFINSWCQVPSNFFLRGGLEILDAFATLRVRYPQLRLTLRTSLPGLDPRYLRVLEAGGVRLIDRFLSPDEMAELHTCSHIFLLPAARIHVVSLLQAMAHGLAVVTSDGWGIEEYIDHERNGLVVPGRYGKASWADEEAGMLREDYDAMYTPDPDVVAGLIEAVSRLVEDRDLRARLGRAARADVETRFNPEGWNRGLKAAFDLARGGVAPRADPHPAPTPVEEARPCSA
jgi:glycosyltransferase involved in cell wall biosynthesis